LDVRGEAPVYHWHIEGVEDFSCFVAGWIHQVAGKAIGSVCVTTSI
jgi:hypothetical protein